MYRGLCSEGFTYNQSTEFITFGLTSIPIDFSAVMLYLNLILCSLMLRFYSASTCNIYLCVFSLRQQLFVIPTSSYEHKAQIIFIKTHQFYPFIKVVYVVIHDIMSLSTSSQISWTPIS